MVRFYRSHFITSGVTVTVAGDGSLTASSGTLATPADKSMCSPVYAILFVDAMKEVAETVETNNVAVTAETIVLRCDNTGEGNQT